MSPSIKSIQIQYVYCLWHSHHFGKCTRSMQFTTFFFSSATIIFCMPDNVSIFKGFLSNRHPPYVLRKLLATMFAITPAAELCIIQDFVHVGSSRAQPGPSDPPPWSRLPRPTATLFPRTLSPCVAQTCLRLCGVRRRQLKKKSLRAGFLIFLILVCMLLCGVCTLCVIAVKPRIAHLEA